jgi:hypothetical protein
MKRSAPVNALVLSFGLLGAACPSRCGTTQTASVTHEVLFDQTLSVHAGATETRPFQVREGRNARLVMTSAAGMPAPVTLYVVAAEDARFLLINQEPEKVHRVFEAFVATSVDKSGLLLAGSWAVIVKNPGSSNASLHVTIMAE